MPVIVWHVKCNDYKLIRTTANWPDRSQTAAREVICIMCNYVSVRKRFERGKWHRFVRINNNNNNDYFLQVVLIILVNLKKSTPIRYVRWYCHCSNSRGSEFMSCLADVRSNRYFVPSAKFCNPSEWHDIMIAIFTLEQLTCRYISIPHQHLTKGPPTGTSTYLLASKCPSISLLGGNFILFTLRRGTAKSLWSICRAKCFVTVLFLWKHAGLNNLLDINVCTVSLKIKLDCGWQSCVWFYRRSLIQFLTLDGTQILHYVVMVCLWNHHVVTERFTFRDTLYTIINKCGYINRVDKTSRSARH